VENWRQYIGKQKSEYLDILLPEDLEADMIVVIPCYDETDVQTTLRSLLHCTTVGMRVMVAIVVNSGEGSKREAVLQNRKTHGELQQFADEFSNAQIRFFPLIFENLPRKHAGVGLARKMGMDLAVEYFLRKNNDRGIIVSLDADCTVSENYFIRIAEAYGNNEKLCATVHNFRHRIENDDPHIENAARQYEHYIRYFENALRYTGFPYDLHTIGSAFSVSADAYVRVGGMGRQQGGEDFYFLQKIFQLGNAADLDDVFVYPMARFSERVPFGTGPALQKIIAESDGQMKVYSMQSFEWLKRFFDLKDGFFKKDRSCVERQLSELPEPLLDFLIRNGVLSDIDDCNRNSATWPAYRKRFFHHFNAFRIIKCLNFLHTRALPLESIASAEDKCQEKTGRNR
jgi:glycosyltransferase involved in cell wall biosynthesis